MSAKIGVQKLTIFPIETEDTSSSAAVYGNANTELVGKTVDIEVSAEMDEASVYADNQKYDVAQNLTDISVSITAVELPLSVFALLCGHTIANGVMECKSDDVAPFVGLAFEYVKNNKKKRFVKLLKGRFAEVDEKGETKSDGTNFQTESLKATFLPVKNNGMWKKIADEEATGYEDSTGTNWYASM